PLQLGAAVALARSLRLDLPASLSSASGTVSAKADLRFVDKRVSGSTALSSKRIAVSGLTFEDATGKVKFERSLLRIEQLQATVVAKSNFRQLGFSSEGALQLALNARGTAQLSGGNGLAVTGTLGTLNLTPEQALLSYDLTGALKSPTFKAQLKTTGDSP
ncbi:MAG: hypothetical protein M3R04_08705, partial [bacterium]|nr:hypothetical protein [bacterium]